MSTKATKRKSQALDNDASPVKTPRTQALPQPTTGSETEPKAAAKPDVEVSHPNSDDDNESNAEDESHTRHPGPFQKIQVLERSKDDLMLLLDNFSDKQVERYEAYRRSALNKAVIKRLVSTVLNQTVSSDLVFVVSGFGKVLVGELVEKAKEVMKEWGDDGAIAPEHLREAYRRYSKETGLVPSTMYRRRRFN